MTHALGPTLKVMEMGVCECYHVLLLRPLGTSNEIYTKSYIMYEHTQHLTTFMHLQQCKKSFTSKLLHWIKVKPMHLPLRRTLNHMYKLLHKGWKVGWHGVLAPLMSLW